MASFELYVTLKNYNKQITETVQVLYTEFHIGLCCISFVAHAEMH